MALAKKLIRDASTLKLIRDSTSGKLMRTSPLADCLYCDPGQAPWKITVTFSGLTDCLACQEEQFAPLQCDYFKQLGVANFFNNKKIVIPIRDSIPEIPCEWYTYPMPQEDILRLEGYRDSDCLEFYLFYRSSWDVRILKTANDGILIEGRVPLLSSRVGYFFYHSSSGLSLTDCISIDSLPNQITDCPHAGYPFTSGTGGQVKIEAGDTT